MKISETQQPAPNRRQATAVMRGDAVPTVLTVTAQDLPAQTDDLARARAFAEPLLASQTLDTGENMLAHADAVAANFGHVQDAVCARP